MAKVYFYKLSNPETGEMLMPPLKATQAAIERLGGTLLTESEEEVADQLLESGGHYDPAIGDAADDAIEPRAVAEKPPSQPAS